jgi:ABC-2 type transport system permease protein
VVNILKQYTGLSSEATLNQSVQALEYNLTLAMDDLINLMGAKIGLVYGHNELEPLHIDDFVQSMSNSFRIYRTQLDGNLTALKDSLGRNRFDLIVIAQPMSSFSEMDKFLIDQHIMHGGRALWLIDALNVSLDSLAYNRNTLALENKLNIDDQLFKYGVRINKNLIQDMQCAVIPVNMALSGQAPQFAPAPWVFFPLLQPSNNHAITKNLDMIKTQFASSIDTVGSNSKIEKTILLSSSKYSRFINAPALVDLSIIDDKLDEQRYNRGNQAVAVLLEGQFNSIYENRIPPELANNQEVDFKEVSKRTKMIVISDGDIIRNAVKYNEGTAEPLPLGYDRFTKETFGNKDFLVNAVNYLCDRNALLESRKKEIKLRLLDKPRIQKERLLWQLINVVAPAFLALLFGIGYIYIRKRRFQ